MSDDANPCPTCGQPVEQRGLRVLPQRRAWTARLFVLAACGAVLVLLNIQRLDSFLPATINDANTNDVVRVGKRSENETDSEGQIDRGAEIEREKGVHPIYLKLLQEAERRGALDFATSHARGEKGFVIGPTEGDDFARHTGRALQNARRLRNVLRDNTTKIALMTSQQHKEILDKCLAAETTYHAEECRLWANGSLFDDVIVTVDDEFRHNDNHTNIDQGTSKYWLKALGGYRYAPYKTSIFLDTDAYPCPGVENLFDIATPGGRLWQLTSMAPTDFAAGLDQYPTGASHHPIFTPGDKNVLADFQHFPERNTGTTLFHFLRPLAHAFAHFIPLVAEHIYNHVATDEIKVTNDQCPFRVALYLFQRLRPEFGNTHIPMHTSCRSYPGQAYAGTDGFANGMYPLQANGQHCHDCYCTPCLIAHHAGAHFVTINGQTGWEDGFDINRSVIIDDPSKLGGVGR